MKIGFIGAGFVARCQAVALQQVRGIEIAGSVKRKGSEALTQFCRRQRLGEARVDDSIGDMAKQVDVIAIYAPNYARVQVMEEIAAAVAGGAVLKGVVAEKPLGRNMREARRMVGLAQVAKLLTAYFENQIHMKALQTRRQQRPGSPTPGNGKLSFCGARQDHRPYRFCGTAGA